MRVGGSFAPRIDSQLLNKYQQIATKCDRPEVAEVLDKLIEMVSVFNETGRSSLPGTQHPSGANVLIIPLEEDEKQRIFEVVPWKHENKMYDELFESIDPEVDKDLRDAAYHLLWYANELELDREPITLDMLDD